MSQSGLLVVAVSPSLSVHCFTRNGREAGDGPLFILREWDLKVIRTIGHKPKCKGPNQEQALRACVRQGLLSMQLRTENASKEEIQQLKAAGVLGKRAPSGSLIGAADLLRLLEYFSKRDVADAFRAAMRQQREAGVVSDAVWKEVAAVREKDVIHKFKINTEDAADTAAGQQQGGGRRDSVDSEQREPAGREKRRRKGKAEGGSGSAKGKRSSWAGSGSGSTRGGAGGRRRSSSNGAEEEEEEAAGRPRKRRRSSSLSSSASRSSSSSSSSGSSGNSGSEQHSDRKRGSREHRQHRHRSNGHRSRRHSSHDRERDRQERSGRVGSNGLRDDGGAVEYGRLPAYILLPQQQQQRAQLIDPAVLHHQQNQNGGQYEQDGLSSRYAQAAQRQQGGEGAGGSGGFSVEQAHAALQSPRVKHEGLAGLPLRAVQYPGYANSSSYAAPASSAYAVTVTLPAAAAPPSSYGGSSNGHPLYASSRQAAAAFSLPAFTSSIAPHIAQPVQPQQQGGSPPVYAALSSSPVLGSPLSSSQHRSGGQSSPHAQLSSVSALAAGTSQHGLDVLMHALKAKGEDRAIDAEQAAVDDGRAAALRAHLQQQQQHQLSQRQHPHQHQPHQQQQEQREPQSPPQQQLGSPHHRHHHHHEPQQQQQQSSPPQPQQPQHGQSHSRDRRHQLQSQQQADYGGELGGASGGVSQHAPATSQPYPLYVSQQPLPLSIRSSLLSPPYSGKAKDSPPYQLAGFSYASNPGSLGLGVKKEYSSGSSSGGQAALQQQQQSGSILASSPVAASIAQAAVVASGAGLSVLSPLTMAASTPTSSALHRPQPRLSPANSFTNLVAMGAAPPPPISRNLSSSSLTLGLPSSSSVSSLSSLVAPGSLSYNQLHTSMSMTSLSAAGDDSDDELGGDAGISGILHFDEDIEGADPQSLLQPHYAQHARFDSNAAVAAASVSPLPRVPSVQSLSAQSPIPRISSNLSTLTASFLPSPPPSRPSSPRRADNQNLSSSSSGNAAAPAGSSPTVSGGALQSPSSVDTESTRNGAEDSNTQRSPGRAEPMKRGDAAAAAAAGGAGERSHARIPAVSALS